MTTQDKLREYFTQEHPDQGPITDDYRLLDNGLLDSMSLVRLLTHLEDAFGVSIADDELDPENFETIETIAAMIASKQS